MRRHLRNDKKVLGDLVGENTQAALYRQRAELVRDHKLTGGETRKQTREFKKGWADLKKQEKDEERVAREAQEIEMRIE